MAHTYTNELIHENSPYLLQHAHNPVNWHAWNEAALEKSKKEDKPILVSIGYAACHWCHVMERESFENVEVADYMNEHFINIKIDREERPDLDHIYMDAVQAIAGNGGWPLNVFLTTDAKPFYGGTYFPPEKAFNRPSWKEILFFINDAWQKRRNEIEQQAETLLAHINSSTDFISNKKLEFSSGNNSFFTAEHCKIINDNILKSADILNGGFGNAPKFPQTFVIQYLLNYGYHFRHEKSLKHAMFSLRQMLQGGIYDQLAGGLARYSTDDKWLVPHFEKMLYDNALLVSVLCDAYQINGDILYKNGIEKTLDFFIKEMKDPEGGFYAALDADSEGVEGKFYVWDKNEIDNILGGDSKIFCSFYGITAGGNWEHKNILHIVESAEKFSSENNMTAGDFDELLQSLEKKLLAERNKRTRPATDDKILLGWNALLLTAFCKASAALGNETYRSEAISLFDFLKTKFSKAGEICYHVYKNDLAKHAAYLDDYACLIQASLLLQELTGSQEYLNFAKQLTDYVIKHFLDKEKGFFYYTGDHQQDVITRKVEIYDSATPSGNSVMAQNLFYLSIVFDKREWWMMAQNMLIGISEIILKHPTSFAVWSALVVNQVTGIHEIVITGGHSEAVLKDLLGIYLPGKVLQSAGKESGLPLLINKMYNEFPLIYLCKNYVCSAPVLTIEEFRKQIEFTLK